MIKISNFNEIHLEGKCNFQFIRVNKGTQVSVSVPANIEDNVKVRQNNNVLTISLTESQPDAWITIRYQNIDQLFAKNNVFIKAEQFFNVKRIELMNESKCDLNHFFSTQSRSYLKLTEDSTLNIHSHACFSKGTSLVVESFDQSTVNIKEGSGDRLECFLYDMSLFKFGNIVFDSIQLNQSSWNKDSDFCAYNSISYRLNTSNNLTLTAEVKKKVKLSSLDFNEIIEGDKDIDNYKPISPEEMFEKFKLFNSEDFLQFLLNPFCTEMIDSSNRTWVIENAKKITIEELNKLNPAQQKSYDSIMTVYELIRVPFSF